MARRGVDDRREMTRCSFSDRMTIGKQAQHFGETEAFFYRERHERTVESARKVLRTIFDGLKPRSVVDFGCGVGTWLKICKELGAEDILGLDGDYVPEAYLVIPKPNFRRTDLNGPVNLGRVYDLAISCELAEHLLESSAQSLVDNLVGAAPVVLFSAACPGQGGHRHLNEQWPSYWASLFAAQSYELLDIVRPQIWNDTAILPWYRQNMLLFADSRVVGDLPVAWRHGKVGFHGLPVVHPEITCLSGASGEGSRTVDIGSRLAMRILLKALFRRLRIHR